VLFLEIGDNSSFGPFSDFVVWWPYLDQLIYAYLDEATEENKYRKTAPSSEGDFKRVKY
jgi:hypothetical protein